MNRSTALSNSMMLVLLLGATASLAAALGTMLMFTVVLGGFSLCMAPLRSRMDGSRALIASLVLAATLTGCADLLAQRWFLPWQQAFGLYGGLIALQCVVLEHSGFFRHPLAQRCRFCARSAGLMLLLAVLRELIGHGTLGRGLSEHWHGLVLFRDGLPLVTLVPGAFLLLGLLLAAREAWTRSNSISKESHRP